MAMINPTLMEKKKKSSAMTVGFVHVFVSDFERALEFYTGPLGLDLDYSDGASWAQFVTGHDVSLAIEKCAPARIEEGSKLVGRFVGVTLMVDDIHDQYDRLTKAGITFSSKPEKQHFGGTTARLRDPDGNVLTLMQEGI
jgi:catechol 2,3-dioxygenase-like lactoylglutathione lyase family enzyme